MEVGHVLDTIAKRKMKRLWLSTEGEKSDYVDSRYLVSMLRLHENLVFVLEFAFRNWRWDILLVSFENEIFLYMNDKYWG